MQSRIQSELSIEIGFVFTFHRWGQTPKHDALRFGHNDVADLIESYIEKAAAAAAATAVNTKTETITGNIKESPESEKES